MNKDDDNTNLAAAPALRDIDPGAFAVLGNDVVAYLKPTVAEGEPSWEVHAADGRSLAVIRGPFAAALAIVRQNDLEPVSLH